MESNKLILRRAYLLYFLIGMGMLAIVFRIFQIQVIEGSIWKSKAENLTIDFRKIEAVRGNIYAKDGSLLATSVPKYEIRFDPNTESLSDEDFYANVDSLAWCLANLFQDYSPEAYRERLVQGRKSGARFMLVRRNAKYTELSELRAFPIFRRGRYGGGFIYLQHNKRQRPFRHLAARTIGYDRQEVLPVGLEGAYRKALRGVSGQRLMQKIAGNVWMPISDDNDIEPVDGYDLVTTLDINIQDVAENALLKQLVKHDAQYGCVVLMEVQTGEIRAIANLSRDEEGRYYENYNYAIGASTEPGSTFKLATFMAALEDGHIELTDSVETGNGKYEFYGTPMYDSKEGGYGTITVKDAFAYSSNIAAARIAEKYYKDTPQEFVNRLYQMGLNRPTGVEIAGEGKPFIKSANDPSWSGLSLPWMSHGYEVSLTPLQILTFYNAVANDGQMMKPMFARRIEKHGEVHKIFDPIVLEKSIASKKTIEKSKEMLEAVVEYGTAINLKGAGFKIAGKTGTAQISRGKYGYDKVSYQASFCGYFPANNPLYSCIVVVNAPSRNVYYGNLVAGPIFREIANKVYSTTLDAQEEISDFNGQLASGRPLIPVSKNGIEKDLTQVFNAIGVPYVDECDGFWVSTQTGTDQVAMKEVSTVENLVPNVVGMDAEDAVYLLENSGLRVLLEGRGVVKRQSIQAGVRIPSGKPLIKLVLS
ncbi:MAG TPA: cell division protein [Flavobacteriales bacterium]|jgi:cell division protein FtsI (penicillin-binding protein 3)|nr:cell division protein [Flavobacteriales bacterium]